MKLVIKFLITCAKMSVFHTTESNVSG